ncbi:MAG: class I SAM-dependent methyltransferase [Deltaproteobacteria bacterium]|nr:class I SAM-dependent methyltransferase [Deltaproteobacteria bacterium]
MSRVLEPELMDDDAQAEAYAVADFSEPNHAFVERFRRIFPEWTGGHVLDLGCGPADIPIRLCAALPGARVTAIDGSRSMLALARRSIVSASLSNRILLREGTLTSHGLAEPSNLAVTPWAAVNAAEFGPVDALISNSLLHHLHDPAVLWRAIAGLGREGVPVLVMDLMRPSTPDDARRLVKLYAADERPVLKKDFFRSLCAALTVDEAREQLRAQSARLGGLSVEAVSDRHLVVWGRMGAGAGVGAGARERRRD